ncbi:MAG: TonB-dependent receptor [Zoogloeaceae bacterium]|nr:TonB-dependent receptor [Zoogloeaceae bacterium]MCK6385767.1 TonB-dependent receptor [Rhodocyclaceae bacterium]
MSRKPARARHVLFCGLLSASAGGWAGHDTASEHVFLEDLPVVLSASRLRQPLADAPGAITIIDRELIRASGAREIVDLFRLVPGFQVGMSYNSRPAVAYHGIADEFSRQMQVLIDGRSAYSPYFLGSIDWNNMRLSLDDIERIEVLRGSNSAAYGANAFMGVINIVTRHPSQSQGARVSARHGSQGIEDHVLRHGGMLGSMHYRITAGRRSDNGFAGFHDSRQTNYLAFRGDLHLTPRDELQIQLGANRSVFGAGFAMSPGDPIRSPHESGHHVQAVWKRMLDNDGEISLNAYHLRDAAQEEYTARAGPFVAPVDADRVSRRSHLEFQHIFRLNPAARMVWGVEQRHESVASAFMFDTARPQTARLARLFGNLEWRLSAHWLLNAGALAERHSLAGSDFAPRLMLNFQPMPGQTLRIGSTTAYRVPSLAEEKALVRYYVTAPFPAVITTVRAQGGLRPERVRASELSYLGEFPHGFTVDARAFHENVTRIIDSTGTPSNYLNRWSALVRGLEYQLRWAPTPDTLVLLNQARMRIDAEDGRVADSAPRRSTALFVSQRLPSGLQLSLAHHWVGGFRWQGWADALPMQRRLDLRLGYPFRSGPMKGEFALVAQNIKGAHGEFRTDYVFERRSFATLSLEF